MANYVQDMLDVFWKDEYWFGGGHSWKEIEPKSPDDKFPNARQIGLQSFLIGLFLLLVRYVVQNYVIYPFGLYAGVKRPKKIQIQPNTELESLYQNSKTPNDIQIREMCKKTDLSERQINIWFRRRRHQDLTTTMKKFQDCSWHFLIHISLFILGVAVLWDKPWFWDSKYIFEGWPHQVTDDMYLYYLIELAVYWNFCFTIAIEHRRKDFLEMLLHHIITLCLLFGSYVSDFLRFGSIVLIVHDAVDYWLAAAKMAKYSRKQTLCEVLFAIFVVSWYIFRLIIFPIRLVYVVLFHMGEIGESRIMYGLKTLLCTLQLLHVIWTCYINNAIINKFRYGQIDDVRSDQESDDLSDNGEKAEKESHVHVNNNISNGNVQNGHVGVR